MAYLPTQQTNDLVLSQLQTRWTSILNPVIGNPLNNMRQIEDVVLSVGANTINHKLGYKMQGWVVTDIQGAAVIYRSAPFNDKTITLNASAPVTISLGVF